MMKQLLALLITLTLLVAGCADLEDSGSVRSGLGGTAAANGDAATLNSNLYAGTENCAATSTSFI